MIKLEHLSKNFNGNIIFKDVSITFPSSGFILISGKSGKGKTTLLNMLSLLDDKYEGDIFINDINYRNIKDRDSFRGNNFSYIFQDNDLLDSLSVEDNLIVDSNIDNIDDVLKKVRLNVDKKQIASTLSGGEYKRLSIARSIIKDAKVIFVDEAISSLDRDNKRIILEILKELSKDRLIMFVTHDDKLVKQYSDYIYYINDYKITNNAHNQVGFENLKFIKKGFNLNFKLKYASAKIKNKKIRTIMILFTMVISLLSFSISTIVIDLIKGSLTSSLSSIFDESLIVGILKEDNKSGAYDIISSSEDKASYILNKYPMMVDYYGTYYFSNFESQLKTKNQFYIELKDVNYVLKDMSIRDVNDYLIDTSYTLSHDEIVLKIDNKTLLEICKRLDIKQDINTLKDYIKNNDLTSCFSLINLEWDYYKDIFLSIKDIVLGEENKIIHSSYFFNQYIYEDVMQFDVSDNMLTLDAIPWTLKKVYYIKIDIDKVDDILNTLLFDDELKDISYDYLENVSFNDYDIEKKVLSGRVCIFNNNQEGISFSYVKDIENIEKYSLPNIYYFEDTLMLESFVNTIFLSTSKFDDEKIEEEYNIAPINLNKDKVEMKDNILIGGFINLGNDTNVVFKKEQGADLINGKNTKYIDEIVISKNIANTLFKNVPYDKVLNKTIYFKTINNVYEIKDDYHHVFSTCPLKIVGIANSEENVIYQNLMWPLYFYTSKLNFPLNKQYIDKIIIRTNDENTIKSYEEKYPALAFKNPSKIFNENIDNIIFYIESGLISFGIIQGVLSIVSLAVIIYLYICENRREIGILLLMGYNEKQVRKLFCFLSNYLCLNALIYTSISLFISSIFIELILYQKVVFSFILSWINVVLLMSIGVLILSTFISWIVTKTTLNNSQIDILRRKM